MFKRAKIQPSTERPYDQLRDSIGAELRSWWQWPFMVFCGVVGVVIGSIFELSQSGNWLMVPGTALWTGLAGLLGSGLILLAIRTLNHSEREPRLIDIGIAFLESKHFEEHMLNTIDTRAEVGMSSSQTRTILPSLIISGVLAVVLQVTVQLSVYTIIMTVIFLFIGLVFLQGLLRTDTDAVIRHAIAEYRSILIKSSKQPAQATNSDQNNHQPHLLPLQYTPSTSNGVKKKHRQPPVGLQRKRHQKRQ